MQVFKFICTAMAAWLALSACAVAAEPSRPAPQGSVGVFGDSLGDGLWSGLYTATKSNPNLHLYRHSKIGAGFTRPDYASWFQDFVATLDETKLTEAVIMVGANDRQGIRDENRRGYIFQSEGWRRTYSARVDAILAELNKRHVSVIWVGLPVMRSEELNSGAQYLNEIFEEATKRAGATYFSLADSFKGEDGAFAAYQPDRNGRLRQIRAEDGIHFTGYGYELLAAKVYAALAGPAPVETVATPTPAASTVTATAETATVPTPGPAPAALSPAASSPAAPTGLTPAGLTAVVAAGTVPSAGTLPAQRVAP